MVMTLSDTITIRYDTLR